MGEPTLKSDFYSSASAQPSNTKIHSLKVIATKTQGARTHTRFRIPNRIQSSRRLERETQRILELIWLTGRLAPDFKTISDFRRDNGGAITAVCSRFVSLCRRMKVFSHAVVAIDGSKLKAVNSRDRNYTVGKIRGRREQLEESVARYLAELDRADRDPALLPEGRVPHLRDKLTKHRHVATREKAEM